MMNTDPKKSGNERIRIMVTAASSGSGKTAVTCGLLALMKNRGLDTCAFKCGPDYIDPMFHRSVLDVDSHNLDVFLAGEEGVREIFGRYGCRRQAVICEGVMGYYDGIRDVAGSSSHTVRGEGTAATRASAWHISTLLDIPAILVIRPKGAALSLAATIKGFSGFRSPSNIAAVILNDCSPAFYRRYGTMIEEESGIPLLGYVPHMEEAVFESRHLGLMTAAEIGDLRERIRRIASTMEDTLDVERLMELGRSRDMTSQVEITSHEADNADGSQDPAAKRGQEVSIAVARDEAFCFTYPETLDAIRDAGGRVDFFSPVRDVSIPEGAGGLYLPGGYPELYGRELSSNGDMLRQIKDAISGGMPTIAECGGFMYLGDSIIDKDGRRWPMTGVLGGDFENTGRLVRFGYGYIRSHRDCMLFREGEIIPAHEFHYWDADDKGSQLEMVKAGTGECLRFGYCTDNLYGGFPHLYMYGASKPARRFVDAAESYLKGKG